MASANLKKSKLRKKAAQKIIRRRMFYAAGLGLIPIPIMDAASILGIQVLMIRDIARLYKIPFQRHQVKSFIGSLIGSLGAVGAVKAIPGVGTAAGMIATSLSGAASTYAIGKIFVQHFDQGGVLLDFDPVKSRQYFQELYEEGQLKAGRLKRKPKAGGEKTAETLQATKTTESGGERKLLEETKRRKALEARRRKALRAKRRRERRNRWLKRFAFVLAFGLGAWFFYFKNAYEQVEQSTEIDLYMQETAAKKVDLQPAENLDSATIATISGFAPNSTEGVVAKYIQSPDATYPKRYALSAVRFTGSSETLSSGARKQLSNIAFLMKKYPALTVNLYGHTTSIGPEFNRQRMGRERARVLKEVFESEGIPGYRVTGNYIEKSAGIQREYWGAEIVFDVATEENVVTVKPTEIIPKFLQRNFLKKPKQTPSKASPELDTSSANADTTRGQNGLPNDSLALTTDAGFSLSLSCGIELDVPENSVETQIVAFIEDESKAIDKTTWFNLDGIRFRIGSAILDIQESAPQINTIAEIMRCFPEVNIKIGGYSDTTGDPQRNMEISQLRAEAFQNVLAMQGIAADRMEAEGYGDQHAVADNDTPEGRAQNRRIALRVTTK